MYKNNGGPDSNLHSLHGGKYGFDRKIWSTKGSIFHKTKNTFSVIENGVELSLTSEDGEEGYPGELKVTVRYTITQNQLQIEYQATSTKKTVVNLTNHAYFNLDGHKNWQDLRNHSIVIFADHFTPTGKNHQDQLYF